MYLDYLLALHAQFFSFVMLHVIAHSLHHFFLTLFRKALSNYTIMRQTALLPTQYMFVTLRNLRFQLKKKGILNDATTRSSSLTFYKP